MTTPTEALRMALALIEQDRKALLDWHAYPPGSLTIPANDPAADEALAQYDEAIHAIRSALAQQPRDEPVAMLHADGHWTHKPGRDPLDRFSGKSRLEVYAGPQSATSTEGRTYTQADILEAVKAERHACSIAVWMTLQDALEPGADDKGLDGWMREAEQLVKGRQ